MTHISISNPTYQFLEGYVDPEHIETYVPTLFFSRGTAHHVINNLGQGLIGGIELGDPKEIEKSARYINMYLQYLENVPSDVRAAHFTTGLQDWILPEKSLQHKILKEFTKTCIR